MLKVLKRLPQTHSFQFIIILKGWWRRLEAHTRDINTTPRHATATTTHISQKDSSDCLISTINEITPAFLILNMLTSTASAPAADVTTCQASAPASRVPRLLLQLPTAALQAPTSPPLPPLQLHHCSCRQLCGDPDSENQS